MSFIEQFLKYKLDFEYLQNCVAEFEELKRPDKNISVDSVIIHSKEKQSGNENNEKDSCQVNPYNKSGSDKSVDAKTTKQRENQITQK